MNDPDRPVVCTLARLVRYAGRLLCWSLATGMTAATADIIVVPHTRWWHTIWPLPWYVACGSALAWALLRACEKAHACPPPTATDEAMADEWEQAA